MLQLTRYLPSSNKQSISPTPSSICADYADYAGSIHNLQFSFKRADCAVLANYSQSRGYANYAGLQYHNANRADCADYAGSTKIKALHFPSSVPTVPTMPGSLTRVFKEIPEPWQGDILRLTAGC